MYLVVLVLPSSCLSSRTRRVVGSMAVALSSSTVVLLRLSAWMPFMFSQSLSWATLLGLSSPVSCCISAAWSSVKASSTATAASASSVSTSTPRSLIRASSAHTRRSKGVTV